MIVFVGLSPVPASAAIVGWSLIATLLVTIAYNIIVLIYCSLRYFKLTTRRLWNRRHLLKKLCAPREKS